ncbi:MAG TPA: hypothetical protein VIG06_22540 [Kofleriaceae bacterium]|jgi:hypothetical protein
MTAASTGRRLAAFPAFLVTAFVAAALVSPLAATGGAGGQPSSSPAVEMVVLPARAPHDRPAPGPRGTGLPVAGRVVTRAGDRVHVSYGTGRPEWLFVRNPVDGRRVSAIQFDRAARVVVEWDESELRMAGIAEGWDDVARLGGEEPGGDFARLEDPRADGTRYRVVDVADQREDAHGPT